MTLTLTSSNSGVGGGGKSGVGQVISNIPLTGEGGGGYIDAWTSWIGCVIWPTEGCAGGGTTTWWIVESGDTRGELTGIFRFSSSDCMDIPELE